jgi:signal transduction histidine kinase
MHRPLDDLVTATRRMASGDLSARVRAAGPTELEALGEAFNTMGQDLAEASARVETQRQRLATTIESLGDGLLIVDPGERITTMNPRARELAPGLQSGGPAHGPHSPLPRLPDALAGEVTVQQGDGSLAITAARLAGPEGGVVWTLRDITERARLEQAKSDFVATASHELRSPLTSIKGFIELLESTNSENLTERQQEFIGIVLQSSTSSTTCSTSRASSPASSRSTRAASTCARRSRRSPRSCSRGCSASASSSTSRSPSRDRPRSPTPRACARSSRTS